MPNPEANVPDRLTDSQRGTSRPATHETNTVAFEKQLEGTGFPSSSHSTQMFAIRFNNKLQKFVSPLPDLQAWAVDALNTGSHLGKVVEKLQVYPCSRIILIAPGWPNMPWIWDLVTMSSQIPLCLPNLSSLLTQLFNQILHRNVSNLNLYAWLLEPQLSKSRASLRQWQHELRLLKEDQPDQFMRQSGQFCGATVIRWTAEHDR